MTHATTSLPDIPDWAPPDIALPSGVARMIEPLWQAAAVALLGFFRRFGKPEDVCRQNFHEARYLWGRAAMLRRLQKIVRFVFVVFAARLLKTAPPPETKPSETRAKPLTRMQRPRRPVVAGDPATWRVGFMTPPRLRVLRPLEDQPLPENFVRAVRNPLLVIARRMEALRRVLAAPMPFIIRLARLMRRDVVKVLSKNPKRKPPAARRDYFHELCEARGAAWWALHPLNTS